MTEASNLYYQNNKERIKQYARNLYLKKKEGRVSQRRKRYNTFKNNETVINKSIEILKQEKRIILYFD
jgi:hypothetical protein